MDVSLSDLLVCPRCGPTYGLVLLPYDVEDRRVRSGVLGCANCRERYPIEGGVADLRAGGDWAGSGRDGRSTGRESSGAAGPASPADARAGDGEEVVRLAGLMGLADAHGPVLLAGPAEAHAGALSALVEGVEVVAVVTVATAGPAAGVSGMRVADVLPFRTGSLRGVALTGARAMQVEEGARVLGREGRLVLDPAPADARDRLGSVGFRVVAEESGVVVATRRS